MKNSLTDVISIEAITKGKSKPKHYKAKPNSSSRKTGLASFSIDFEIDKKARKEANKESNVSPNQTYKRTFNIPNGSDYELSHAANVINSTDWYSVFKSLADSWMNHLEENGIPTESVRLWTATVPEMGSDRTFHVKVIVTVQRLDKKLLKVAFGLASSLLIKTSNEWLTRQPELANVKFQLVDYHDWNGLFCD